MSNSYFTLGYKLPHILSSILFGDRRRFGLAIHEDDLDWKEWQIFCMQFYQHTQKGGVGKTINNAGYEMLSKIDLADKHVLEVGAGALPHRPYWKNKPAKYTVIDIRQRFIDQSMQILKQENIISQSFLSSAESIPLESKSADVIISFYSLEHMYPLDIFFKEFYRILKPGGILVGAIPCEGGLAWGLGRFLTSRRYMKKHSSINPDKIICWEHPNYADQILRILDKYFTQTQIQYWPLRIQSIDLNLLSKFIYTKNNAEQ